MVCQELLKFQTKMISKVIELVEALWNLTLTAQDNFCYKVQFLPVSVLVFIQVSKFYSWRSYHTDFRPWTSVYFEAHFCMLVQNPKFSRWLLLKNLSQIRYRVAIKATICSWSYLVVEMRLKIQRKNLKFNPQMELFLVRLVKRAAL